MSSRELFSKTGTCCVNSKRYLIHKQTRPFFPHSLLITVEGLRVPKRISFGHSLNLLKWKASASMRLYLSAVQNKRQIVILLEYGSTETFTLLPPWRLDQATVCYLWLEFKISDRSHYGFAMPEKYLT